MANPTHADAKDPSGSNKVARVAFVITLVGAILFIGSAYIFVIGPA